MRPALIAITAAFCGFWLTVFIGSARLFWLWCRRDFKGDV